MQNSDDKLIHRNPELGPLLRLFSSLGITMTFGTVGFFLIGLFLDRMLKKYEISTYGIPIIFLTLFGVASSVYWCYLRIIRHLEEFPREPKDSDRKTAIRTNVTNRKEDA